MRAVHPHSRDWRSRILLPASRGRKKWIERCGRRGTAPRGRMGGGVRMLGGELDLFGNPKSREREESRREGKNEGVPRTSAATLVRMPVAL